MTTPENVETLRCNGSHTCPAERHIFGCFRSTLADDVEGHPNWLNVKPSTPENVECQTCGGEGRLVNLDRFGPDYRPCPTCTENVEEPT